VLEAVIQKDDLLHLHFEWISGGKIASVTARRKEIILHLSTNNEGLAEAFSFMNRKGGRGARDAEAGRILSQSWVHGGGQRMDPKVTPWHREKEMIERGEGEGQLRVPLCIRVHFG